MLNRLGNELIGTVETLPLRWPPKADEREQGALSRGAEADRASRRSRRSSTSSAPPACDPLAELKKDRRVRAQADPCFDHRFRLLYDRHLRDRCRDATPATPRPWPADLKHFPAGLREPALMCETKFSTTDLENHLISLGEYCALYLDVWSNAGWQVNAGKAGRSSRRSSSSTGARRGDARSSGTCTACFKGKSITRNDRDAASRRSTRSARARTKSGSYARSVNTLTTFYDALPRVRRALANVPTYMIFDDHDVTDDWNIVARLARPGLHDAARPPHHHQRARRLRALPGLGQRPAAATARRLPQAARRGGQALRRRHRAARGLRTAGRALRLDRQLGEARSALNRRPREPDAAVKWHWSIDGPHHRVIALDTRTRRSFRSRYRPPALLSPQALEEQLPDPATQPLPPGVDVVVVISQTPIAHAVDRRLGDRPADGPHERVQGAQRAGAT